MCLAAATEWVTVMAGRLTDHLAEVLAGAGARKTEGEVVAQFERWAKNPAVREWLLEDWISPEERRRRVRKIYGLPPEPAAEAATTASESNPVKPNPTQPGQIKTRASFTPRSDGPTNPSSAAGMADGRVPFSSDPGQVSLEFRQSNLPGAQPSVSGGIRRYNFQLKLDNPARATNGWPTTCQP